MVTKTKKQITCICGTKYDHDIIPKTGAWECPHCHVINSASPGKYDYRVHVPKGAFVHKKQEVSKREGSELTEKKVQQIQKILNEVASGLKTEAWNQSMYYPAEDNLSVDLMKMNKKLLKCIELLDSTTTG